MFGYKELTSALKAGKCTRLFIDKKEYLLSESEDFQQTAAGCSGILCGTLAFELRLKETDDGTFVNFSFSSLNDKKVRVGDIKLLCWSESTVGKKTERCVFGFCDTLLDQFVHKANSNDGKHKTIPMCLVYDLTEKESFFAAQYTFDKNKFEFDMDFDPLDSSLKSLICRIPDSGYSAGKEQTFTDQLFIRVPDQKKPYDILCSWGDMVKEHYQIKLPEKIVAGFITGLLVSPKAEISTSQIRRQLASPAVEPLKKLGMNYLWISLDNIKKTLPGNWLYPNEKKFPDGLVNFLKEVESQGINPGFWIGFFQMCEGTEDFDKVKDFLIRKEDGKLSSRGEWSWEASLINGKFPAQYSLDPGKNESADYLKKVFSTYKDWGIRYHMVDFLETGLYEKDDLKTGYDREAYIKFMRKIKDYCHPETQLLAATGASLSLIGAVQTSRIGLDYGEGRPLEKFYPSYPATYVINGSFGSMGSPNRNAVNNLAMWAFAHDRFFQCNCNMMTVDKPIPLNEAIISATLFGISPSPVYFGDDMDRMSPDRLALIKKVLPRCHGMPEPVDLFSRFDGEEDFLRTFVLKIEKPWATWYVCAVFNLNDSYRKLDWNYESLNLDSSVKYRMYDFWNETYCGVFAGQKTIEIPANSAAVFRFEEVKGHPWILSTDIHVRQGDAELEQIQWDPETGTLSGTAKRTAGEQGNIFIIADDSFIPENANRGLMVSKTAIDMSIIIKKTIKFTQDSEKWSIRFEK